ncbi:hypothetical protein OSB04_030724 [Centaurea solstitialis]|uniref:Glycosyltransferase n=1 Tax=Centaurea solstitialis TaxID=347529 RepID=A0AA38SLA2_9ASTR|nr:hypothetical protein OSB04_030724 [Centaurea solstitialis]
MDPTCEGNKHTSVLLVTLSAQGHINPILRLGNRLASKGLDVTLAATSHDRKTLSSDVKSVGRIRLEFFSDGLPSDYDRSKGDRDYVMDTLAKYGPVNLLAFIRSHTCKFACIIHTPFIPWVADVAAEVGVPSAMLWIQPSTLYQIYYHYYNRLEEFPTQSSPDTTVKLPGLPVFTAQELPSFVLPTNPFPSFDRVLREVFSNIHKAKWVLGNSFMELEKDVITSMNDAGHIFRPVGPIVPASLYGEAEDVGFDLFKTDGKSDCIEWLDKQNPSSVVYISFGTLLFLSQKEIESIAIGLKRTKRPFLWVINPSANQNHETTPEFGFMEEIKEQGLIVRWSPQTAVLSHPSVGCFLSHCGWNSLLESLVAGVPIIACPQWTDQPTNAKLVTEVWGVGVKLTKNLEGVFDGEEVERCVEEVMGGRKFKEKAEELKMAAREAVADGGSSDKNIQMFVNEIICSSSSSCNSK